MKHNRRRGDRARAGAAARKLYEGLPLQGTGLPPGSPVYLGDRQPTSAKLSLYLYDEGSWLMECPVSVGAMLALVDPAKVSWMNVNGLSGGAVERLCEQLGIHPLVAEDILNTSHRPKVESYGDYLFVVAKMLTLHEGGVIEYEQVSIIVKGRTVLTFQETPGDCFGPVRDRIANGAGRIRRQGADFLAYALLDVIVDNYFVVLESLGDRLEEYELMAGEGKGARDFMRGLQEIKGEFQRMRRTVWPVRDSIVALQRLEGTFLSPELAPFLRDLHENSVQAIEALETYREHAANVLDIHLASTNNRMGEVMKVLTIISTIFIPLTFIAGVYGMNFRRMPELDTSWGYPLILGVMALVALGELIYFKLKKWI